MWDLSYWATYNFVAVCAFIMLVTLLRQSRNIEKNVKIKFYNICMLMLIESVCSTVDSLAEGFADMMNVRMIFASIGYISRPGILLIILLIMNRDDSRKSKWLYSSPLLLELAMLLLNIPFRFMFTYEANDGGTGNTWVMTSYAYIILYLILVFYMAVILATAIKQIKNRKSEALVVLMAIGFMVLNFIVEEFITKDDNTRQVATAIAIITYYIYFVSRVHVDEMMEAELEKEREQVDLTQRLLDEAIETLSSTIDAKDKYTHGHSARVAKYSRAIAEKAGMNEKECRQVYYAGLLHDIGKIAVPEGIINKAGKLTDLEYDVIKTHPDKGRETLDKMKDMPYLALGAEYHHERYDGTGYPNRFSGKEIPEVGRIIAVADAYDAMTSKRSYRSTLPQALVREQILMGRGSQFDPRYANIMLDMIDEDTEYNLKEEYDDVIEHEGMVCKEWWSKRSDGIRVMEYPLTLKFGARTLPDAEGDACVPSFIFYDSDDSLTNEDENAPGRNDFREYAVVSVNAQYKKTDAREVTVDSNYDKLSADDKAKWIKANKDGIEVCVTVARYKNVIKMVATAGDVKTESRIVLRDSYSWSYLSITGVNCVISDREFYYEHNPLSADVIPSFRATDSLADEPMGDIPNVECDGWNSNRTDGIRLDQQMVITYKTKTYPKAKRIWHSSIFQLFTATGKDRDIDHTSQYFTMRSDGEFKFEGLVDSPDITVIKSDEFTGWDDWLNKNKEGVEGKIIVTRAAKNKNKIYYECENAGVTIKGSVEFPAGGVYGPANNTYVDMREDDTEITTVSENEDEDASRPVYVAISGELCSITGINVTGN